MAVVDWAEELGRLRRVEAEFRTVFEVSSDAILLSDVDARTITDANPAACRLFGYTHAELVGKRTADLVHPDSLERYALIAGLPHDHLALVGRRADGSPIDVEVTARNLVDFPEPRRCILVRQITDKARAFELLEGRVAQRTRELLGMLHVSRAVSGTLDLRSLLGVVLDQMAGVVEYTEACIVGLEDGYLCILDYRGPLEREMALGLRFPRHLSPLFQAILHANGPVIDDDVHGDSNLAQALRSEAYRDLDPRPLVVRSILGVPLKVKDRVIGQLRLGHAEPGYYSQPHADLALTIANQAAVAIENARLFEEAETRRRALEALYHAEESLYRSLEPREVLDALVDAATELLGADKTSVLLWDAAHEHLTVQASRGFSEDSLAQMSYRVGEGISTLAAQTGEMVVSHDAQNDSRVAPRLRAINVAEDIQAMISVPIKLGSDVFGVFNLQYRGAHPFKLQDRRLLQSLAQRAAIALDNARTFAAERAMRERLDVALAAGRMGTWEFDARANRLHWSPRLEVIHGLEPGTFPGTLAAYLEGIHPEDRDRVRRTIEESLAAGDIKLEYRVLRGDGGISWFEATGHVLRDAAGEAIGMHGVCQDVTTRKEEEAERARLQRRERAASEARAALEERQRLARELHDSVSQALYGIALGSQTAIAALREDHDPEAAADAVQYVHKLAEAAMTEMRALILELRPDSLAREGLVAALERQVASLRSRHGLEVRADFDCEPTIELEQKEALYRIAQEAMHNALKHAHASSLSVRLRNLEQTVRLDIRDDGVGFDTHIAYPGHLGLTSMRERAIAAGGGLDIASERGHGTCLTAHVPARS